MFDLFAPDSPSQPKALRPHQQVALEMIRQSAGKGNRCIVCQGPTGFGKTLVATHLIRACLEKGNCVIFTAPAVNLIDQTVREFEAEGITDIGVMQADHQRTNPMARVQVASIQTLARREIPEASLIIVDECHIRSEVIEELMRDRPDVFFIGLSATPWTKGMGLLWSDLVIPCTLSELIDEGYLSQFTAYAPDVPDLSGVETVAGEYHEGQASKVMEGKALIASVVETWLAKGENRPTLLFGTSCAHAKGLHEEFKRAGVASAYIDAYTDDVERQLIERRFRAGEIKVACSVRTLTTGTDWPVSCIIDAAPTKSLILHVQKIGRGLRVNPGSEDLLILDHAGNSLRNRLVTDIQFDQLDATPPGKKQVAKKGKSCRSRAASATFCIPARRALAAATSANPLPTLRRLMVIWSKLPSRSASL
jgi:superfamily II DNA or RNA helicase